MQPLTYWVLLALFREMFPLCLNQNGQPLAIIDEFNANIVDCRHKAAIFAISIY